MGMARTGRAGMMESSFTFLKVRGIRIGAHWSWLLVFAYISWALGTAIFPQAHPGLAGSTYLAMGLVSALAFFASIVLHELGHAFRALREGMRIDGITLWLFGGVARFSGMFPSAGAEFRIAVAGPIVSVAIAAVFALLALASQQLEWPGTVRGVTEYLARINAILVGFNMVPALPLDGGRVLRAWLWHRQGSFTAATVSASRAGRAFAYVLIGIGILAFFSRARGSGIWFVFLGWFLLQAAQAEASFAMVLSAFRHLRVRDLMSPDPVIVSPDMTVAHFLSEVTQLRGHSSYPVADGGRLAGLVSLRLAAGVPLQAREQTTVAQVMLPRNDVPTVPPDSEVLDALEAIRTGPGQIGRAHV